MSEGTLRQQFEEHMAEKHACYVLITCDDPQGDGRMSVEMNYHGDPVLAAYLVDGAANILEETAAAEQG